MTADAGFVLRVFGYVGECGVAGADHVPVGARELVTVVALHPVSLNIMGKLPVPIAALRNCLARPSGLREGSLR